MVGVGAAVLPWLAVTFLKPRFGYDDSLDAFGVHGIGGMWGAIATGLWANKLANPDKPGNWQGLFQGNPAQLWIQVQAAVVTMVFSFLVSLALLKLVDVVMGLRVSDHEERVGLDLTQHKETGYTVVD